MARLLPPSLQAVACMHRALILSTHLELLLDVDTLDVPPPCPNHEGTTHITAAVYGAGTGVCQNNPTPSPQHRQWVGSPPKSKGHC